MIYRKRGETHPQYIKRLESYIIDQTKTINNLLKERQENQLATNTVSLAVHNEVVDKYYELVERLQKYNLWNYNGENG